MKGKIYILTGGTINKIAPHLAISSPAYGTIGDSFKKFLERVSDYEVILIKTKMADAKFHHNSFDDIGLSKIETNCELKAYIKYINSKNDTKAIIMSCAVADFTIKVNEEGRLNSTDSYDVTLIPSEKLLQYIRNDIITISFKTLYDEKNPKLKAFKNILHSDLVFVNDIKNRTNGIAFSNNYYTLQSRDEAILLSTYFLYIKLGLFSFRCQKGCGIFPLSWENINYRCDCGGRRGVMSFNSLSKDYYNIDLTKIHFKRS